MKRAYRRPVRFGVRFSFAVDPLMSEAIRVVAARERLTRAQWLRRVLVAALGDEVEAARERAEGAAPARQAALPFEHGDRRKAV